MNHTDDEDDEWAEGHSETGYSKGGRIGPNADEKEQAVINTALHGLNPFGPSDEYAFNVARRLPNWFVHWQEMKKQRRSGHD